MSALPNRDDTPMVLREDADGVAHLTLNRPAQFNALSEAMLTALIARLDAIAADDSVRVVVLSGAGKAFCAGHDLKEMRANHALEFHQGLFRLCGQLMLKLIRLPQPVIARVHGIATAAGCQLVSMCDLAVAAEVSRFAVSGINVGLFCSTPAVGLSRNMGRKEAFEMLVTGEFIGAAEAQRRGLVNRVVPLDQLDAAVAALTASICAKTPVAVKMGKQLFYQQLEMGIEAAYQSAAETMACNMMTEDAGEGIDAFVAKRAPVWKGR
ncbi:MAG: enoyl-CoA hydratase [Rhodocyclaceae bacterium]|nr:enoyl-CoA hydratase [Rhodocyclaceae bacterium]MCB1962007.1 enoyl-CoA hydratase [Rhodocyclaceae bacterium]